MTEVIVNPIASVSTGAPSKKSPRKKTTFYHTRSKVGVNHALAAQILGVSIEQVQEWDKVGNDLAERYLLLYDSKNINVQGWNGFVFTRGKLKFKNRYWTPEILLKMKHDFEENTALHAQVNFLTKEVEQLKSVLPYQGKIDLSTRFGGG